MTKPCNIVIIVAMARNGIIGAENKLPWYLPGDLKRFRKLTMGHTVVMGRKTFESLPNGPLPGRRNVVLSRSERKFPEGVVVLSTLDDVLKMANENKLFIIGGGDIYRQLLPFACCLELTLIDHDFEGDTRFPQINDVEWVLKNEEAFEDTERGLKGWFRTLNRMQ
jgi:dihydrofolate reductase